MEEALARVGLPESRALSALVIFAAFAIAAKAADLIICKLLSRLARFTKSEADDKIIAAIHGPIFFTVLIAGAVQAVSYLGPPEKALFYTNASLYSVLAFIWALAAIRVSGIVTGYGLRKVADITSLGKDVIPLIENVLKVLIVGIAVMVALSIWKVNITPLLASAGIVGVAVALAAKDTLANFFGGISIFIDRPYKIGDYIVLDGKERGEVTEIGIRSTRIRTRDDVMISIPNSIIANSKIVNESAPIPLYRIRIPVGVAYGSDIDLVEKVLMDITENNHNVVSDPGARVRFRGFGDSSLNFELLCWIKEPSMRGMTLHELNKAIYKAFGKEGITIPFPQRDVHIKSETQEDR